MQSICQVAPSNYVGMYGTSEPGPDGEGIFFRNSRIAAPRHHRRHLPDDPVGERSHRLGEATWAGSVTECRALSPRTTTASAGTSPRPSPGHGPRPRRRGASGPATPGREVNQFYSLHSGGGVNFLFADGHVDVPEGDDE